ncbi:hypothetical protein MRX96_014731 [Rhipicephalus microplus]
MKAPYDGKADERTYRKPYREPHDACDVMDYSVVPERGCLLVLTVGLLVAMFVIASLLLVRFRYQTQLPQETVARYFHEKMHINGTMLVEKSSDVLEKPGTAIEETLSESGDVSPMPMTIIDES